VLLPTVVGRKFEILPKTKRMKPYLLILSLAMAFSQMSCNKDEEQTPPLTESTPTELLTAHAWKYKAHVIDVNNNGILDEAIIPIRTCLQDDIWYLKTDFTHQLIRGSVNCNSPIKPTLDVNNSGNWQLLNNGADLKYNETNNGETLTGKIITLNDTSFVFGIQKVGLTNLTPMEFDVYKR
jgi:hypothetical protein